MISCFPNIFWQRRIVFICNSRADLLQGFGFRVPLQVQIDPKWAFVLVLVLVALGKAFAPAGLGKVPVGVACWGNQQAWEGALVARVEVEDLPEEASVCLLVGDDLGVAAVLVFPPDRCQRRPGRRQEHREGVGTKGSDAS